MDHYDDVIIGAGSAGAVVAARLSEDPARRVLVLEAGPDHRSAGTPPGVAGPDFLAALATPGRLWEGIVARATPGQPARPYPRGRGVGGSSAVNAMIALWGDPADHERWVRQGCPGWDWASLAPWRARVEQRIPRRLPPRPWWSPVDAALVDAALAEGHPWCADPDAAPIGAGPARLTILGKRRVSTNDAYLEPARNRPNLTVRGDAEVEAVALDGRRAVGVRLRGGEQIAAGRVVCCAGAVCTPALLLRSGVDRPGVGGNLAEHPSAAVALPLRPPGRRQPGPGLVCAAVVRYTSGLAGAGVGDMQLLAGASSAADGALRDVGWAMVAVMDSYSRGRVSVDGAGAPVVDLGLLTDERDRIRLRDGVRHLRRLLTSGPFVRITDGPLADPSTGARLDDLDVDSDAALDAWLDTNVGDYVHAASTCRMGPADEPGSVVDPTDGAVHGYAGLHVADASVMPDLPRANPHLTAVLIGERLAAGLAAQRPERLR